MQTAAEAYQALEKLRGKWNLIRLPCLAAEIAGAVLLYTGSHTAGIVIALAGLLAWLILSYIGKKQYQRACADCQVRFGIGLKNFRFLSDEETALIPPTLEQLIPPSIAASKPLILHALSGELNNTRLTLCEATAGYRMPQNGDHLFLSGVWGMLPQNGLTSGGMILVGHPYGETVRISDFPGFSFQNTAFQGLQVLTQKDCFISEESLAAVKQWTDGKEPDAVLITDKNRLYFFLHHRFYSGTWTLTERMPESALSKNPLPEISSLPALAEKLAGISN